MQIPNFSYVEIQQIVDRFTKAASLDTLLPEIQEEIAKNAREGKVLNADESKMIEDACFERLEELCNEILTEEYNLPTDIYTAFAGTQKQEDAADPESFDSTINEVIAAVERKTGSPIRPDIQTVIADNDDANPGIIRAAVSDIYFGENTKQSIVNLQDFKKAAVEIIAQIQLVLPTAMDSLRAQRPGLSSAVEDSDVNFTLRVQQAGQKHVSYQLATEIPHLHPQN